MALEFDISSSPPALADIAVEREQAKKDRAVFRKKNIRFLIYIIIIVASVLSFILLVAVPSIKEPEADQDIVFMFTYFMPYLIFAVFILGNKYHIKLVEKPSKVLDATIATLKEVNAEELKEIVDAWHHHGEITSYLQKVTSQGRSLVQAEINAIQQWLELNKQAE